jgi:hypothetical protein
MPVTVPPPARGRGHRRVTQALIRVERSRLRVTVTIYYRDVTGARRGRRVELELVTVTRDRPLRLGPGVSTVSHGDHAHRRGWPRPARAPAGPGTGTGIGASASAPGPGPARARGPLRVSGWRRPQTVPVIRRAQAGLSG